MQNLKSFTQEYKNEIAPSYYKVLGSYYSEGKGPYLLGEKISYVDFAVYQSIDNDQRIGSLPVGYPLLHDTPHSLIIDRFDSVRASGLTSNLQGSVREETEHFFVHRGHSSCVIIILSSERREIIVASIGSWTRSGVR